MISSSLPTALPPRQNAFGGPPASPGPGPVVTHNPVASALLSFPRDGGARSVRVTERIRSVSLSESSRPFRSSRQSLITKSVVARKSNSQTSSAPAADWLAGWLPSICCVLRGDEDRSGAGRSQSTGAENGPELNSFACR